MAFGICTKTERKQEKVSVEINLTYPECEDSQKSVACHASLHIYNVLAKGMQHKSMVKFV